MLHVFKGTICAEDMANPSKSAACLSCGVPLCYLLGPQSFFFFQAFWGLPVAAYSLDQEHHLGLVLSLYPDTFLF